MLAAVLGCSIAAYMFYVAGFDPWLWWSDYRNRTAKPTVVEARRPPTAGVVLPEPIGTDSSVSATPRKLLLKSTHRGRNAFDGTAEIGIHSSSPQTYRAGALLANGTRLREIYDDSVVLERDGQSVRLYVDGRNPSGADSPESSLLTVGGQEPPASTVANSRDALTDIMRVSPVFEGDGVSGLVVHANDRSDTFARLGLQPGDQITAVDGIPVTDMASSLASLRELTRGQALVVTVKRQGQVETLSLDGSLLKPPSNGPPG